MTAVARKTITNNRMNTCKTPFLIGDSATLLDRARGMLAQRPSYGPVPSKNSSPLVYSSPKIFCDVCCKTSTGFIRLPKPACVTAAVNFWLFLTIWRGSPYFRAARNHDFR
jgi:hypothetical protein